MTGGNNHFSSVLYYPRISFQNPAFIKSLSFLYDHVYRVVPSDVIPEDDESLLPLIESECIGKRINPTPYAKEASDLFMGSKDKWNAAALLPDEEEYDFGRLHRDKADVAVRRLFDELGYANDGQWYDIPTSVSSNYMLFLAKEIARKNRMELITDEWGPWAATSYFNVDGEVNDLAYCGEIDEGIGNQFMLYSYVIEQMCPLNIHEIPAEKILSFREKRQDEIQNTRNAIADLYYELNGINEFGVRSDIIDKKVKNLQRAQDDYHKSADIIKVKGWHGVSLMSFAGPGILMKALSIPFLETVVLAAGCVAIGSMINVHSTKDKLKELNKNNPASGIMALKKDFKQFTGRRNSRDVSFYAWNILEEYVCD